MGLLDERAMGVYVVAVTLFTDTGASDPDSADRMVGFDMERRAAGSTLLGMMGEAL